MPQTSVIFGLALCGLTVFGMVGSPEKLATAFIPMMLGIPLVFCGIVSLNPHRKKSWMWVAGTVAAAGLLASFSRLAYQLVMLLEDEWVNRFSLGLLWGVFGLCLGYLVILTVSMLRYHRRRQGIRPPKTVAEPTQPTATEVQATEVQVSDVQVSEQTAETQVSDKLAPSPPASTEETKRQASVSSSLGA